MYETILYEKKENVAYVMLNRPEVHNAFNSLMISELDDAFEKVRGDKSLRVVILTGEGESFSGS